MPLSEIAPQLADMIEAGLTGGIVQHGKGGELLTLAVKISRDAAGHHVITFEDITRQLLDQRQAAWSDVARRIAHEIKNPLTPIQLATERLSRRYRKQILTDPELFEELTVATRPIRRLTESVTPWQVHLAWWLAEIDATAQLKPQPHEVESFHWLTAAEIRVLPNLLAGNVEFLEAWAINEREGVTK